MKIGIMSDSHGSVAAWEQVVGRVFHDCDLIIHAGDVLYHGPRNPLPEGYAPSGLAELINLSRVPVIFARGNCDADIDAILVNFPLQAPYAFLYVDGKSVLVTHGTDLDSERLASLAAKYKADVLVSGHTHVPRLEKKNGTVFVNPGSCSLPKGSEGATAARWEDGAISLISLAQGTVISKVEI